MRNFITNEWLTIFTLIGIVFIALAKSISPLRFGDFLFVVGNSRYLKIYSKDRKLIDLFSNLLFLNLVLSLSIFFYFLYSTYIKPLDFELGFFLKLLVIVIALIVIKLLIEKYMGQLFGIQIIINNYLFQKMAYKNYSGFIFLIANIFLIYTNTNYNTTIITITLTTTCLINGIGFMTSFKYHQKIINSNFFYFLLYLCALEIGPYIILYKVLSDLNT